MSLALDVAFYSELTGDTSGVNDPDTGAIGGFHNPVAPQSINSQPVGYPRVHFMELVNTASYSFRNLSHDTCYYQFTVYAVDSPTSAGITAAKTLAEQIRALLTDSNLTLSSGAVLYCRFDRTLPIGTEWDEINGRYIYSQGLIMKVITG